MIDHEDITLVRAAEGPFPLDDIVLNIDHRIEELTEADVEKSRPFPADVQELAQRMTRLVGCNNFSGDRAPFIPLLRRIVQELFQSYAPKRHYSCLEIGPGPVAYAATRLLPLEKMRKFGMLEISLEYHDKIRPKARAKGWKLFRGDFHTMNLGERFDVAFGLSSFYSTPFLGQALANVYRHLNEDGVALLVQDVFPCPDTLIAHEYIKRKSMNRVGTIRFGVPAERRGDDELCLLWIENIRAERVVSWTYLRQELAEAAVGAGFTIAENGVWYAHSDVGLSPKLRKYFRSYGYHDGHNTITSHILLRPGDDPSIAADKVRLTYAADILVLRK